MDLFHLFRPACLHGHFRTQQGRELLLCLFTALLFLLSLWMVPTALWFAAFPVWLPWKGLFSSLIGNFLLLVPCLLVGAPGRKLLYPFYALFCILASVHAVHILLYDLPVSAITLAALHETNPGEIKEFLLSYLSPGNAAAVLACWLIPLPLLLRLRNRPCPIQGRKALLAAAVLLLAAVSLTLVRSPQKMWKYHPFYQLYTADRQYKQTRQALASLTPEYLRGLMDKYEVAARDDTPLTLVVFIGESASRRHHGCYGYPRDTTPFMTARQKELFLFSDMISAAPTTSEAHKGLLLLPVADSEDKLPLMNVLNAAGMQTWWITSQYSYDSACSPLPFLADRVVSINNSIDKSQFFDEAILPELANALESTRGHSRAIFLNIMGSHVKYDTRYPQEFARFTGSEGMISPWAGELEVQEIINRYDNSVLYTDAVLEQVIRLLEKEPDSALIYLSDHGQEVFDEERRFGHSMTQNCGFEIPFFLWLSPSFQTWRGNEVSTWKDCVDRPSMSDCLGFLIADLLDLRLRDNRRNLSPLSRDWSPQNRTPYGYPYDRP